MSSRHWAVQVRAVGIEHSQPSAGAPIDDELLAQSLNEQGLPAPDFIAAAKRIPTGRKRGRVGVQANMLIHGRQRPHLGAQAPQKPLRKHRTHSIFLIGKSLSGTHSVLGRAWTAPAKVLADDGFEERDEVGSWWRSGPWQGEVTALRACAFGSAVPLGRLCLWVGCAFGSAVHDPSRGRLLPGSKLLYCVPRSMATSLSPISFGSSPSVSALPWPSWPFSFLPQHLSVSLSSKAHV
jgi:hypothetical protein